MINKSDGFLWSPVDKRTRKNVDLFVELERKIYRAHSARNIESLQRYLAHETFTVG